MNMVLLVVLLCAATAFGQTNIRSVDFKNFTYPALCIGETASKITVKNGEFSEEKQEDGYVDRFHFNVMDVAYGDLNADRRDEAIVLSVCNTGGTGNFSEGFIYSMRSGKPLLVARIPGGDRAYGGLRSARVEGGLLVVESNDVGPEGGACCPQFIVTTKYRLTGGRIVKSGKELRRDIYPTQRVSFPRGQSGTTIKPTIPAEEGRRYVLGARANQSLSVSIDTDKASIRLLDDEAAEVTHGANRFVAKLNRNGDYTIEVQNDSNAPLTLTITIRIN